MVQDHTAKGMSTGDRLIAASQIIAERWNQRIRSAKSEQRDSPEAPPPPLLSRNMPQFIARLGLLLNNGAGQVKPANYALLTNDPPQASGISIATTLREYMLAREVIFEFLEDPHPLPKEQRDRIYRYIEEASCQAATHYARLAQEHQQALVNSVQNQKEQIEFILDSANIGLWSWDITSNTSYISPTAKAQAGLLSDELQDNFSEWQQLIHPDDRKRVREVWKQVVHNRQSCYEIEYRIRHRDSHYRYILSRGGWLHNRDTPAGILMGIHVDITARKTAEEERVRLSEQLAAEHRQIEAILENMPAGVIIAEQASNQLIYHNRMAVKLLGHALNHQLGGENGAAAAQYGAMYPDGSFYRPEDYPLARAALRGETLTGEEMHYRRGDGKVICVSVSATPIRVDGSRRGLAISVFSDISDLKATQRALTQEKELAQVTLRAIGDGVITTDAEGLIEQMNPAAERLTGWSEADARGRAINEVVQILDERDHRPMQFPLQDCLEQDRLVESQSHALLRDRQGNTCPIDSMSAPIHEPDGQIMGAVIILHDISEQYRMLGEMAYQARHDALTGLVNRREFERRLNRTISDRDEGRPPAALLFLDLDRFKLINDTCGHTAGDDLLRQLTALFNNHVRDRDTLARLGGDEFAIILEHCDVEQATRVAESLRQAVQDFRFVCDNQAFQVGVSIGLVPIDYHARTLEQVLTQADNACYAAKEAGRNRVHVVESHDWMVSAHKQEVNWINQLRTALDQGGLQLFLQKIIPLTSGPEPGERFEVLLRLKGVDGDWVAPATFLPVAERYDLMPEIDYWVVEHVLQWLAAHPQETRTIQLCTVNISARTIADERAQESLRNLLSRYAVPPEKICFEITEAAAVASLPKASKFIRELKDAGFRFALDDFGTGMASFTYLKQLPVDYLKIDGSFVENVLDNGDNLAIVRSINEIGHIMGKQTIAEFVGTEAVVERLRDIGVDFAQGYHIGTPRLM